jgi:hypothetical protein
MTKELDTLLSYIEKDGGFRDACITFQERPLSMFEGDLQNFLELLQIFKNKIAEQCSRVEDLRNKMFQGTSTTRGYFFLPIDTLHLVLQYMPERNIGYMYLHSAYR